MKLIQPPSYASLRSKLNDPRAKAGLTEPAEARPGREPADQPNAPRTAHSAGHTTAAAPGTPAGPAPKSAPIVATARKVYKFRVPVPVAAPGSEFAKLIDAYGEADAMGMILKSALDAWVAGYGPDTTVLDQPSHPTTGASFGTTRRFDAALVADVRRRIDPYDRRTDGFIAQRIAVSALSAYLS